MSYSCLPRNRFSSSVQDCDLGWLPPCVRLLAKLVPKNGGKNLGVFISLLEHGKSDHIYNLYYQLAVWFGVSYSAFLVYRNFHLYKNRVGSVIFRSLYILKCDSHMTFSSNVLSQSKYANLSTWNATQLQNTGYRQRFLVLSRSLLSFYLYPTCIKCP